MNNPIELAKLTKQLVHDFELYTESVSKDIADAVEYCTDYAKREIEKHSPESDKKSILYKKKRNWKSYKKGWIVDFRYSDTRSFGMVRHTSPKHSLVHLLELGHKARNYEKNNKMVAPVPHVNENEDLARGKLDEMIDKILSTTK